MPLRTCIACQQQRPKRDLIRLVRTAEGTIQIDPRGKHPGRGAYLCFNRSCLESALELGKLGRALKCQVDAQQVEALRLQAAPLFADSGPALEPEAKAGRRPAKGSGAIGDAPGNIG